MHLHSTCALSSCNCAQVRQSNLSRWSHSLIGCLVASLVLTRSDKSGQRTLTTHRLHQTVGPRLFVLVTVQFLFWSLQHRHAAYRFTTFVENEILRLSFCVFNMRRRILFDVKVKCLYFICSFNLGFNTIVTKA